MGLNIGTLREIGAKKGDVVSFNDDCEYKFTIEWLNDGSAYGTAQHCGREFSDNWSLIATKTWRILSPAEPTGPVRTDADATPMLTADNKSLREAGNALAIAAIHVANEYDGVHRLMLAVAEWSRAVANEGGRGDRA